MVSDKISLKSHISNINYRKKYRNNLDSLIVKYLKYIISSRIVLNLKNIASAITMIHLYYFFQFGYAFNKFYL